MFGLWRLISLCFDPLNNIVWDEDPKEHSPSRSASHEKISHVGLHELFPVLVTNLEPSQSSITEPLSISTVLETKSEDEELENMEIPIFRITRNPVTPKKSGISITSNNTQESTSLRQLRKQSSLDKRSNANSPSSLDKLSNANSPSSLEKLSNANSSYREVPENNEIPEMVLPDSFESKSQPMVLNHEIECATEFDYDARLV